MSIRRNPLTPDDLREASRMCTATLRPVLDRDWSVPAHGLEWSCRLTLDHICDCLAWYAHDLAAEITGMQGAARDLSAEASLADLLLSVEALAEVLAIVAAAKEPDTRAWHDWGMADAEGFLGMGIVEILVHTWDIAQALGTELSDPDGVEALSARVIPRLFPDAVDCPSALTALLASTGRLTPPDGLRITSWRWHSAPLSTV